MGSISKFPFSTETHQSGDAAARLVVVLFIVLLVEEGIARSAYLCTRHRGWSWCRRARRAHRKHGVASVSVITQHHLALLSPQLASAVARLLGGYARMKFAVEVQARGVFVGGLVAVFLLVDDGVALRSLWDLR